MSSNAVPLSELYEKALSHAAARGLMPAQEQKRLELSMAAVLAELQRYRAQKRQVSRQPTALSGQKPSLFYGLNPVEARDGAQSAKEASRLKLPGPQDKDLPQRPKPGRSVKDKPLPFGPMPVTSLQALGHWMKKPASR